MESSFRKLGNGAHLTWHDVLAEMVVRALWAEFPGASENEVAEMACEYFIDKYGKPVSARTVRNWLRKENMPGGVHLTTLMLMQPTIFLNQMFGRPE